MNHFLSIYKNVNNKNDQKHQKSLKMEIFVIYIFVNAQKVVHPRGFNHMSFVISAVTTTQCSMKKLEKLSLKKNLANHTGLSCTPLNLNLDLYFSGWFPTTFPFIDSKTVSIAQLE